MFSSKPIPESIGKYKIKQALGKGAMGIVYLGYDELMDRDVAIKVLHQHLVEDEDTGPTITKRFRQEAKASARCMHPNIVSIFDFGFHQDLPYIVMEYVDGVELRTQLLIGERYSLPVATDITIQVLEGLQHAHGKNIVHRDIKPANIILLEDGSVKVSDFGVARLDTSDLTGTGFLVGTPNYMSPEALSGKNVDHRADLYSVGVLFYELLTTNRPIQGVSVEDSLETLHEQTHLSKQNIQSIKPILKKALHPHEDGRYQSAEMFIEHLRKIDDMELTEAKSQFFISPQALTLIAAPNAQQNSPQHPANAHSNQPPNLMTSSHWASDTLEQLESSLAKYLGPMAHYVIKKSSKTTDSIEILSRSLAGHIPQAKEQKEFLRELSQSGILQKDISGVFESSTSSIEECPPTTIIEKEKLISTEDIDHITQALLVYLGPIAGRMVKKAAQKASSLEELIQLTADAIPSDSERTSFLEKVTSQH